MLDFSLTWNNPPSNHSLQRPYLFFLSGVCYILLGCSIFFLALRLLRTLILFGFFSLEPEWAAAATEVKEQTKGKVKLAAVDATVNQMLAGRYGVSVLCSGYNFLSISSKSDFPLMLTKCSLIWYHSNIISSAEH